VVDDTEDARRATRRAAMTGGLSQVMAGCVVLVTADRRSGELGAAFERRGAVVRHAPALGMVPHTDDEVLVADTRKLIENPPDVVIATTGVGFRGWIEAADAAGLAAPLLEVLGRSRIVARGPKARGAVQAAGLNTDWVAESETAAEIIDVMLGEGVAGLRIAVQHHGAGSDGLDEAFLGAGADVQSLIVYRWGPSPDPAALDASVRAAASGEIDAVVFTSAPGAYAWLEAADAAGVTEPLLERFADHTIIAAAVGPVTAGPLRDRGIEPLVPDRGRLGALVRTVVAHFDALESQAIPTVAGPLQMRRSGAVLAGHVLPLTPGALAVLRLLADARGDVVPRSAVLDALPGTSQDEHAAEVAIARLREASGSKDLIRTVVKRGYRLNVLES
jgi:uroporphyrinogen-III synthase